MKSQRPLTGSLQVKNGKYYSVINEYVNGERKQNWVYTGYKVVSGTREKRWQPFKWSFSNEPRNATGPPA